MPTAEERIASLEARMDAMGELRPLILDLRDEMDRRFDQVGAEIKAMEGRTDGRMGRLEHRFERLEAKVDQQFVWVVGIQMTFFIALVTTLAAVAFR